MSAAGRVSEKPENEALEANLFVFVCTLLYTIVQIQGARGVLTMKVSITEARRRLPELVRRVRKDAGMTIQITLRDEVVAEIRPALPEPEPGAAARKLVELMESLPKHRGAKRDTSRRVKEYLYAGKDNQD